MKTLIIFTCFFSGLWCSAQSSLMQVTDVLKIKQPGSVDVSADGKMAVFTLTSSVEDEKNKWEYPYETQLWMVALDGQRTPRPLTSSKQGASQPTISPDGSTIAFVRSVDQKPQIFLLSLKNGGEPLALTNMKTGAFNPQWSADGKKILFSSSITLPELYADSILNPGRQAPGWSLEKPGLGAADVLGAPTSPQDPNGSLAEVRAWLQQNEKDNKAKVINKLNFQQESTTSSAISFNHLFLVDANIGAKPKAVTKGFTSYNNAQFTGNTYDLVAEAPFNPMLHPDRAQTENAVYRLTEHGTIMRLFGAPDSVFSASISPSGKWMLVAVGKSTFASQRKLAIVPAGRGLEAATFIPVDRSASGFDWSQDERYVYFTCPSNGGVVLHRYTVATKNLERLTTYDEGIGSFDEEAGKLVMVKTAVANPFELYVGDPSAQQQQRISSFNEEWIRGKQLSFPEKRSFKNEKGLEVEYWVMKPANWESDKAYPVILEIHGGPTAMWGPGESSMWHEYQYYCSRGYAVVYSNPRGSGGYGEAFMQANINDWGDGPMRDVLKALESAANEFKWIDTTRMAVTGGSYAGYLIGYLLGHDQRFKAACAQRGVYDLRTFFGEGNAWRLVPAYFGGYPWDKATYETLERESPINYVQHVTTPLIIFHGENDLRTGVIQSEQFYRSLKVLGREVEYVRHPGATHEITRSGNNRQRIDQMLRTWEFFERFIRH